MKLKEGDKAPDFTLPDQNNKMVHLADFQGKKAVVLAFFIKASTSGWTVEMKAYQAGIAKLTESDAVVFGISGDKQEDNAKFAKEIAATFPILSDPTLKTIKDYGIFNEKWQLANRVTFVVDKEGIIRRIEMGKEAIDPTGTITMCGSLHKPKAEKK